MVGVSTPWLVFLTNLCPLRRGWCLTNHRPLKCYFVKPVDSNNPEIRRLVALRQAQYTTSA